MHQNGLLIPARVSVGSIPDTEFAFFFLLSSPGDLPLCINGRYNSGQKLFLTFHMRFRVPFLAPKRNLILAKIIADISYAFSAPLCV